MKWIPISTTRPPYSVPVLVSHFGGLAVMELNRTNATGDWFSQPEDDPEDSRNDITHWIALYEPPPVTI